MSSTCCVCNKAPATVHITRIQNNQIIEQHFCANCANPKPGSGIINLNNNASDLLNSLINMGNESEAAEPIIASPKACPCCGLTYNKFKEIGKMGCPDCYITFKDSMKHLLRRMHGSAQHQGKNPSRTGDLVEQNKKVWELRQQLQHAVKSEDYEQAAQLRDLISEAENN